MPKNPKKTEHDFQVLKIIEEGPATMAGWSLSPTEQLLDAILHTLDRIATALEHRL